MRYRDTTALITGASSGLGAQFAGQLAARGADLVLVARRADRLEALAHQLRDVHGVTVTVLAADLGRPEPGRALREALLVQGVTISTLINNAGLGSTGLFADTPAESVQAQIAVNIAALVDLSHTFLPDILEKGVGALVNVASLAAYQPLPQMAVYAASKAFVLHFTEALAFETRPGPVKVLALSPGPTRTEFYSASRTDERGIHFQTAEEVVATALGALDAPHTPASVISGRSNRFQVRAARLLPRRVVLQLAARSVRPGT